MKYTDLKQPKIKVCSENKTSLLGFATGIVLLIVAVVVIAFLIRGKMTGSFNPISIVSSVAAADLKETDGRTNILVLGSDKRSTGNVASELTDTILVASIGKLDKDVVLISIPRDLWVKCPSVGNCKINEVFAYGSAKFNGESDPAAGMKALEGVVEEVLGLPIHYHGMVNFELFKASVDTLGGVDIVVDKAFTDTTYPIEGKEDALIEADRYQTVRFEQGLQKMGGETALKYARSRHGDNNEGTDFARAKRQQKVIMAIKNKAMSIQTLINPQKLKELYDLYATNVETNVDLPTLQNFYLLSQQINFDKVISVVLDDRSEANDGGLLYAPEDTTLYGGRYILIPRTGDYAQIHAYVQKYVFGEK